MHVHKQHPLCSVFNDKGVPPQGHTDLWSGLGIIHCIYSGVSLPHWSGKCIASFVALMYIYLN